MAGSVLAGIVLLTALAGCGQRGPLYIPGKPGDPYFDRQNRAAPPAAPDSTKPATPAPPAPQPARESEQKS